MAFSLPQKSFIGWSVVIAALTTVFLVPIINKFMAKSKGES